MSSILFGNFMVPSIESDYILLLRYSILYKEDNLTGFNHKETLVIWGIFGIMEKKMETTIL